MATDIEIIEPIYANFARGDVPAVLGAMADRRPCWADPQPSMRPVS
ncbi:MAG: hypothetical protein ABIP03_09315 [Aquihabitans sp.]